jgi:catechol 2,3-dioxygenase-like lactoylglutathione lyase family enzyme
MSETGKTTRITQVGTVIVPVSDQELALAFYLGTLGFEKRADYPLGEDGRWIEVSLATQDADADHGDLLARGAEADATVMRLGNGVPPMFTFRDPDGNRFRMVERD